MKNMKGLLFRLCLPALFIQPAFSGNDTGIKLVEKVSKKGDEICIPFERYVLSNGLALLIHEDHSDPIVHVDVTYHVGSAREQEGRSGFAHFFEHMMFQGSDHIGDEQHFKIVSEAGGTLNGSTTSDRTNYFETLPANQLEKALWLESDRMGFLLDAVTQEKFEVQRSTVKNERGQNYDNRPYGLVGEKTEAALYPQGHPYSWPTIGYIEDLNRVDVNDLKKFFMRWYGPNNAVLTVAGDVKPADVLKLVEKYYGSIPRGPEVKRMAKQPAVLDKDRYISYEDRIRFPMLSITWPGVNEGNEDETALDALAQVLGGDKNSIFYQKFVKSQVTRSAQVFHQSRELAGVFKVNITAFPGKTLAQIDSMVRKAFAEFEAKGVKDEDIKKFKSSKEYELISSLTSVSGKASTLAHYYTILGDANFIGKEVEALHKLRKEDVMRVYNKYLHGKPAVYLSVYPLGKSELIARPDNYSAPKHRTDVPEGPEYKNLSYNKAKDNFDRNTQPPAGPAPMVTVPDFWKDKFVNGLKLIGVKNNEVPLVAISISLEAGHRQEDPSKAGIANLCARVLNESTTKHSAEEINDMLDMLGSSVSFSSNRDEITMNISALTKNLASTLKIAEEMLGSPKFDAREFDTDKKQALESIANSVTQPTTIADNVYNKLMYGDKNILSVPEIGTEQTLSSITLDDVKKYYADHYSPSIAKVVVVGDVDQKSITAQFDFLKQWTPKEVTLKADAGALAATGGKTKIFLVNKDKAAQSVIKMGELTGMKFDATGEYFKSSVMNFSLGGAFNSRINLDLREKRGFTYGAHSVFNSDQSLGTYTVNAPVRTNSTDSALMDLTYILKDFNQHGITPEELDFTKKSISLSDALKYETLRQKAGFLKRILDYDLDKGYVKKQSEILNALTKADLDALAKKYIVTDNMLILLVGDKKAIYPSISKLGYEIVELDMNGNVLPATIPEKGPAGYQGPGKK
jgi:zinc protease